MALFCEAPREDEVGPTKRVLRAITRKEKKEERDTVHQSLVNAARTFALFFLFVLLSQNLVAMTCTAHGYKSEVHCYFARHHSVYGPAKEFHRNIVHVVT